METETYQDLPLKLAPLLSSLSHPARLQIVLHLSQFEDCTAGSIASQLPLSKSTVSQHMSRLKEAGLITCTADGVCQKYRLSDETLLAVRDSFLEFYNLVEKRKKKRSGCILPLRNNPGAIACSMS